jgi:hypothetical protein
VATESLTHLLVKLVTEELDAVTVRSFVVMVFWMPQNNVTMVHSTPTSLVPAGQTAHYLDVEMELLIQVNNATALHALALPANCYVVMEC